MHTFVGPRETALSTSLLRTVDTTLYQDSIYRYLEVYCTYNKIGTFYFPFQAMRGNHTQAKHLFWRAIHACPGNKAVWMDALRGDQRRRIGENGLRPVFRAKELKEVVDAMLEKSLHLRAEPP